MSPSRIRLGLPQNQRRHRISKKHCGGGQIAKLVDDDRMVAITIIIMITVMIVIVDDHDSENGNGCSESWQLR